MNCRRKSSDSGSTLLVALVIVGAAILFVATSLSMALQRNKIAMRSMVWNQALAVAEAGIEEGLAQIQYAMPPTNAWTPGAGGTFLKTRSSPFADTNSYFDVNLLAATQPVITATGYVRAPLLSSYIKRVIQVTAKKGTNQFPYGLHAKGTITISGSSTLDSFDSTDPNYSTNGMYDPKRHKDNCRVVSQSGSSQSIKVGTGKIFGYVETGPGAGTVSVGSSGAVGDNNYVSNSVNAGTIQMSPVVHALTNYNMDIVDVQLPSGLTSGTLPASGPYNVNGTNYTYALGTGTNYWPGSMSIPGGQSMIITGQCTLYVSGSFTLSGSGFVWLAPGASLRLYVGTTNVSGNNSITLSGGGIANGTGVAANLSILGLPSVKTATYSGSSAFIGVGNTPNANATLSGSTYSCGSIIANTATLSGGMNFHYDESQGGNPYPKYTVIAWREL